ncbi:hypothetical protein ABIE67_010203 [Streptomyces sp. V4I8]
MNGTAPATAGAKLNNTVTVQGNDPDPNPGNNTSTVTTDVLDVPMIDTSIGGVATAAAMGIGSLAYLRRRRGTEAPM